MKIVVHQFTLADVEDPDLFAAQPLWEWQDSEAGRWVMAHATETPQWLRDFDTSTYGHKYRIVADLKDKDVTYYNLKWGIA